jgi:hypothetical protein
MSIAYAGFWIPFSLNITFPSFHVQYMYIIASEVNFLQVRNCWLLLFLIQSASTYFLIEELIHLGLLLNMVH